MPIFTDKFWCFYTLLIFEYFLTLTDWTAPLERIFIVLSVAQYIFLEKTSYGIVMGRMYAMKLLEKHVMYPLQIVRDFEDGFDIWI